MRAVVGDRAYVSGSCGPTGEMLKPCGDAEPDDLYDGFRTQIRALIEAGVDSVCVETMTFDPTPNGFHTIMGASVEQAATGLAEVGADLVGSNCGNGIEKMVEIAREFRRHTRGPLIIQSNAGLPEMKAGLSAYGETPEFMVDRGRGLMASGVSIIGCCCGTTPAHIRAIRKMVDGTVGR